MKLISSLQTASQWLAVRLYTRGNSRSDRQRGASALEYIVLAAVIVVVVIAGAELLGGDDGPIKTTFKGIADSLSGAVDNET